MERYRYMLGHIMKELEIGRRRLGDKDKNGKGRSSKLREG